VFIRATAWNGAAKIRSNPFGSEPFIVKQDRRELIRCEK
jgi:hypothetical protein